MRALRLSMLLYLAFAGCAVAAPGANENPFPWFSAVPEQPRVDLYFFWSSRCPHCREARPFIESLPRRYAWIRLHSDDVLQGEAERARFERMAALAGTEPRSVPTFIWCGRHMTGYEQENGSGRRLLTALAECFRAQFGQWPEGVELANTAEASRDAVEVPGFGTLNPEDWSLPLLAVVLGGLDAINPCAFFVLLFLLSLLVNTRSRPRMLLVGGVFVAVSGLAYFAFMAAWLNLFRFAGTVQAVTLVAGLIALLIGALNVKDYFVFGAGPTLSLSHENKSRLFERMRGLLGAEKLPTLLFGTLTLAVAANTYELLCTAGLPMVFTRLLTLQQLPVLDYYAYLALYNLVYVTPLALIVAAFVLTMGRRKLSQSEGRFLKLLSGCMMGLLGMALIFAPARLSSPLVSLVLIGAAIAASVVLHGFYRARRVAQGREPAAKSDKKNGA